MTMESQMTDFVPVACSLTDAEFREREAQLLARFKAAAATTRELPDGFAFLAAGEKTWITLLTDLIAAERECCPFLRFELTAEPNLEPVTLSVTGPAGSKAFVKKTFCNPEEPVQKPG